MSILDFPTYQGEVLPVYPPEAEVCFNKADMRAVADRGQADSFLRIVHPYGAAGQNALTHLLEETDEQLEELAAGARARVVPHQWGLYRLSSDEQLAHNFRYHSLLPEGHALVADVAIVRGFHRLKMFSRHITKIAIENYIQQQQESREPWLYDMHFDQFGVGSVDGVQGKWLVDIEPKLVNLRLK